MTTPKKINNIVDKIVDKYKTLLRYLTLGPAALSKSEIKLLIKEKLLKPEHYKPTIDDMYTEAHLDLLQLPSRQSVRDFTLKHLKESAGQYIDKWADKVKTDLGQTINNIILNYTQQLRETVPDVMSEAMANKKTVSQITQLLKDKTQDFYKDWERIVISEMGRAQNLGSLDAITENNKEKPHDEVYVYFVGPNDNLTCKFCRKWYFAEDGITPRVYKLSEVLANGDNFGKRANDWKATVAPMHPRCRHMLLELPKGYGFKNGKLSYISKSHDEFQSQNS